MDPTALLMIAGAVAAGAIAAYRKRRSFDDPEAYFSSHDALGLGGPRTADVLGMTAYFGREQFGQEGEDALVQYSVDVLGDGKLPALDLPPVAFAALHPLGADAEYLALEGGALRYRSAVGSRVLEDSDVTAIAVDLLNLGRKGVLDRMREHVDETSDATRAGAMLEAVARLVGEDDAEFRAHLRSRLDDARPAVQLAAASALGPDGVATLRQLAGRSNVSAATRRRALYELGTHPPDEEHRQLLRELLEESTQSLVMDEVYQQLSASSDPESVAALVGAVPRAPVASRLALAKALKRTRSPQVEPALIALLIEDAPVVEAAADGLATLGSADGLAPLRRAREGHNETNVRTAIDVAIELIEDRNPGLRSGQIALVGEAGQLAIAAEANADGHE